MRARRPLLRTALVCVLLALSAFSAAGCGAEEDRTLVVLGPWTAGEEKPFVAALAKIGERTGHRYVYEGTRSLRETLVAQLRTDSPPDVAILSGQGELAEYARDGDAKPLPEELAGAAISPWAPRVSLPDEHGEQRQHAYWVPVRVDLKSLVWSRAHAPGGSGGDRWCLGMESGGMSGWPGTDWIEDLLLQLHGSAVYERWATGDLSWTGPEVRSAWRAWRTLLTADGARAGEEAISTSFESLGDGRYGLLNRGDCAREHQGSFIRRHYGDDVTPRPTAEFLAGPRGLPGFTGPAASGERVFEVSGDMAAVFTPSDAAWELMSRLVRRETRDDWAAAAEPAERPFFPDATTGPGRLTAGTSAALKLFREAERVCFDASDAMPPTLRGAFHRAVLEFLHRPRDARLLDGLLKQLESERLLQEKADAFALDHLCVRR
ncbi:hypothetical protein [Streptomyces sp. NPDC001985]|uniref:hypothetical protein n=1 Tax=Streptomyces sp. NPDC001985 TaxID=3154406 RepID=UPI0033246359